MPRHFHIITLGCPKNSVDSRQISGYLANEGYVYTEDADRADVILVNTCGFIEDAKIESIEAILDAAKWKEKGSCEYLIVTGCLAQKYSRELAIELPEVDAYVGTGDIPHLPALLDTLTSVKFMESCKTLNSLEPEKARMPLIRVTDPNKFLFNESLPLVTEKPKHYAYIKIAEGCDNRCSYCVIPSIRGNYRSRRIEAIADEAEMLVKNGVRELILVAQDTTYYGMDNYRAYMLPDLLKELVKIPDLQWVRLLYSYPKHITERLLDTIENERKICSYLDIPLQHISDRILKAMRRTVGREETIKTLKKVRSIIPDVTLRSTFIVGFPGETKEEFAELLAFIAEAKFDRAGFFAYSAQPQTPAADLPDQVPDEEKQYRLDMISNVQTEIMAAKLSQSVNSIRTVMVDGLSTEYEGFWEGRTSSDAPEIDSVVYFKPLQNTKPGDLLKVKITHSTDFTLLGEVYHESSK